MCSIVSGNCLQNKLSNMYVVSTWMSDPAVLHKVDDGTVKTKDNKQCFCKEAEEIILLLQFVFFIPVSNICYQEKLLVYSVLYQNDPVPKRPHSRNGPYQQRLTFM